MSQFCLDITKMGKSKKYYWSWVKSCGL